MKTTTTKIVRKEFGKDDLFVELEKMLDYKHPFTLVSSKNPADDKFRLEYMTEEVEDDAVADA